MKGVGPVPGGQDNRTVHLSTREGYGLSSPTTFNLPMLSRCCAIELEGNTIQV